MKTLPDLCRHHAVARPDARALVFGDRTTTYGALHERTSRVAQALLSLQLPEGARIAVVDRESDHALELLLGAAKAGAVVVFVSWRLAPAEIADILADAEPSVVFLGPDHTGRPPASGAWQTVAMADYPAWRDAAPAIDPLRSASPDDVVVQMYTSGTTGRPKGVRLAHRSFFAVVDGIKAAWGNWIDWTPDDVALHTLPNSHIGGLWWAVRVMAEGATSVLMDSFAGHKVIDLVKRHRVTKLCLVPAMMQVVLSEPSMSEADFSSAKHLMYGGSPTPPALLRRAMRAFGCGFYQVYGLTETGNMAVWLSPEEHADPSVEPAPERMGSAGRPYPGVRAQVIDARGVALPPRQVGEIRLWSPARMVEYWRRPAETAAALRDGWIHTGDAGYFDEDGYLYVSDRVKDMIIYAGENIYPAEVENAIHDHPAVQEVAVIGVPDDKWGELVKAIVVVKPGTDPSPMELIAHARSRIAAYKLPKSVDFVTELPRTRSGKIKKQELRAPYWQGRTRNVN